VSLNVIMSVLMGNILSTCAVLGTVYVSADSRGSIIPIHCPMGIQSGGKPSNIPGISAGPIRYSLNET